MVLIVPGLSYLTRAEWGARTDIPRLGNPVARAQRTEAIIHHTVIVDDDATKNVWETLAEVKAKMVQLQTIRPDLGLDVPYNFVGFLMADGSLIVCEGRGLDLTGAHTYGHNTKGVATAFQGNFDLATNLQPYLRLISRWLGWLRYDRRMINLQSKAFGHKDFASTACPGTALYLILPRLTFTPVSIPAPVPTSAPVPIPASIPKEDEMTNAYIRVKGTTTVYRVEEDRLIHAVNPTHYTLTRGDGFTLKEVEANDVILDMPAHFPLGVPKEMRS